MQVSKGKLQSIETDTECFILFLTFSPAPEHSSESEVEESSDDSCDQSPMSLSETSSCCLFSCYQNVMNEFQHTPYICLFISHRYVHCISRSVEAGVVKSFTDQYILFHSINIELSRSLNIWLKLMRFVIFFLCNMGVEFSLFRVWCCLTCWIVDNDKQAGFHDYAGSFLKSELYQSICSIRLPTQLSILDNYSFPGLNEAKKVSAGVFQDGLELHEETSRVKRYQTDIENHFQTIQTNFVDGMGKLYETVSQDYSHVHKCYYLKEPVYSTENRFVEEDLFGGTRGSRRNSNNLKARYCFAIQLIVDLFIANKQREMSRFPIPQRCIPLSVQTRGNLRMGVRLWNVFESRTVR